MSEPSYAGRHARLRDLMDDLAREIPGPMSGFARLHASSVTDGALQPRVKELMALAISIALHCEGCIAFHVHDAFAAGASREEIAETIGVALLMRGGPAAVYGSEALDALAQFEAERAGSNLG